MKNKEECIVKKIVLKIDDKEISLTPEQAKKLKELLNDMFGKEIIKEIKELATKEEHHHYHDHYPSYPYWYYIPPSYPQPIIYCRDSQTISCSIQ